MKESVQEIAGLFSQIDTKKKKCIHLLLHDRVLRYSFVMTDECAWIYFFANSPERATVPALKVRAATPLYEFFSEDVKRLLENPCEAERPSQAS